MRIRLFISNWGSKPTKDPDGCFVSNIQCTSSYVHNKYNGFRFTIKLKRV